MFKLLEKIVYTTLVLFEIVISIYCYYYKTASYFFLFLVNQLVPYISGGGGAVTLYKFVRYTVKYYKCK